ncbi:MAG: hypothetical protein U0821_03970 [Chloroflexota bacterium]
MSLDIRIDTKGFVLDDATSRRVHRQFDSLARRLVKRPDPRAELQLEYHAAPRRFEASLRVHLGPLGPQLISHQIAPEPDLVCRLAVNDVKRELERRQAVQRGEPTFGVPSRRNGGVRRRPTGDEGAPPEAEVEAGIE